jgi:hypothetical protein
LFARLTTALALVAMLLHSALGCCWHHDHLEIGGIATTDVVATCDHHHDSDDDVAGEPAHPNVPDHQHMPCDQGHCISVSAQDVRLLKSVELVANLESLERQPLQMLLIAPGESTGHRDTPAPGVDARHQRALLQTWRS